MSFREVRGPGINAAAALLQEVENSGRLIEQCLQRLLLIERILMRVMPAEIASEILRTSAPPVTFEADQEERVRAALALIADPADPEPLRALLREMAGPFSGGPPLPPEPTPTILTP